MSTLTVEARIRGFVDGRRGWHLVEPHELRPDTTFAWKGFLKAPILLVHTHNLVRYPWGADVAWEIATDSLAQVRGTYDEVEDFVDTWEKALALPARLGECRNQRAAKALIAQVPQAHITRLTWVLDDESTRHDRDSLVSTYGPPRKGIFG